MNDEDDALIRPSSLSYSLSAREAQHRLMLSPPQESPATRSRRYDVAATMDRLKSSLIGSELPDLDAFPRNRDTGERKESHPLMESSDRHYQTIPVAQNNNKFVAALSQLPAIVLIALFHLMIGIPFGVSYFPIGWGSVDTSDDDDVRGTFPAAGKESLGIRMFLFSTVVGQIAFTMTSGFGNPIGLQMVENVPFCHALSHIVISHQGYGVEALSTLFVMFGLSSIIVGAVFFLLGRLNLGRVVYYFPTHVLVGCIGGIGLFIAKTGVEVTIAEVLRVSSVVEHLDLLVPVLAFELLLRFLERATLDRHGKPTFSLLSPIFFCLITPVFYAGIALFRVDMQYVNDAGYFFPALNSECEDMAACSSSMLESIFNDELFEMWKVINFSTVSLAAIFDSIPTLLALTLFSLIHVPINIPAFALSTGTEADMNKELVSHGYSNFVAGMLGGLQNYMAYTQSVLYHKSGGSGKGSGIAVAVVTSALFFVGPLIGSYIPRCMAGTLLVHVGIDLFLEGVYDSYGKFDRLEYSGIWLITAVMTAYGMDAAMIAGGVSAVSTHAVQTIHYVKPIRGSMSAATLRSSRWNRSSEECRILEDNLVGRNRILVIQLQGHLFFGVIAQLMGSINNILKEKADNDTVPWIVILDFSLVLGIDSSAAQTMSKLRNVLQKSFKVEICLFVTGSTDGFPCEFDLSNELIASCASRRSASTQNLRADPDESTQLLSQTKRQFRGSHVENSLDLALIFAEDALLARQGFSGARMKTDATSLDDNILGLEYLKNLCPGEITLTNVEILFSRFTREEYVKDNVVWGQGSPSTCMKLLVRGILVSQLEREAGTRENVDSGNIIGELGLIQGIPRMSSVICLSETAVLFSLSRSAYEELCNSTPHAARLIDLLCIRYLTSRAQHVSNRIFETRCLPI